MNITGFIPLNKVVNCARYDKLSDKVRPPTSDIGLMDLTGFTKRAVNDLIENS
ncbi:MAG: hypothetical protein ABH830_02925 [Patescibacteria group bacterium]